VIGLGLPRLQLKRRSARQQQKQDHQPIRFHIGRLVGSHREGKKPMLCLFSVSVFQTFRIWRLPPSLRGSSGAEHPSSAASCLPSGLAIM
jgi:hypothetical protein